MTRIPNRPEELGYALGEHLARWYDGAEPKARLKQPALSPRCRNCVFRKGTLPNGCVTTTMDALKCTLERTTPFLCAHREKAPDGEFHECAGWQAMMLADDTVCEASWPFSDEVTHDARREERG